MKYGVFVKTHLSIGRIKRITDENYFFAIFTGTKEQCKWFIERRKYRLM
jgi:hypothetical protein